MKRNIVAVRWDDACGFEEESLEKDHFVLSPTIQIGMVINEDDEKIQLVHSFSLDDDQHDFIVIPKSIIKEKRVLGWVEIDTGKIGKKK
ncbi:MAG: hypothetical protein R6U21_01980 [Thermoplasmatota archaeon]